MNDDVGISNKLLPLERSGESLKNRGRQNPLPGKKKGRESGEISPQSSQIPEDGTDEGPEETSAGKIVDIVI